MKAPASAAAYLESVGASNIRVEMGGKHPRLLFFYGGREQFYILSATPSHAWAGERNMLSDLRHMTGNVNPVRIIGVRRSKKRIRRPSGIIPPPKLIAPQMTDWQSTLRTQVSDTMRRRLLDLAWTAWFREILREVGGTPLI